MNISPPFSLLALGLVMAGLLWLIYRAAAFVGRERMLALVKDPPFVLLVAGGLLALFNLVWLLTHWPP